MERLNKFISRCGEASRRKAEELIRAGAVSVNGKIVSAVLLVDPDLDEVCVNGRKISPPDRLVYYMINKPIGYASTLSDPHIDRTVKDLLPVSERIFPVGRLDVDSCGLLILTNDGELTHKLTHPSYEHEKEYEVFASWIIKYPGRTKGRALLLKFEEGVLIDGIKTLPAKVDCRKIDETGILFRIVLKEGRNRQIRKMCEAVGLSVRSLTRLRIGKLELGDLMPGEFRKIKLEDIVDSPFIR